MEAGAEVLHGGAETIDPEKVSTADIRPRKGIHLILAPSRFVGGFTKQPKPSPGSRC